MTEKKKYPFYFYLLALLIPVLFFVLLELGLRAVNYGEVVPQWVQPSKQFPDYLMLNPEISRRYFRNLKRPPTPHYDGFLKIKKENTFRVFIMGGSSAAGFPYPVNGAFSHFISRYLKTQYPAAQIEVINVALSAINSYTIRDLFPGVLEKEPDLVIIYAGHNEYYGALGAGSSEFWGSTTLLVNFMLATQDIRTMQLLRNIIIGVRSWFSEKSDMREDATLMARMVGKQLIPLYSQTYYNGISQFRDNMSDIFSMAGDQNVPVILGTLTSNLKDQPPFESIAEDSLPPAGEIYDRAGLEYKSGLYQKAQESYSRARELDALRFRAPNAINETITELADTYHIPLVDIDSVFRANSPHQIIDHTLMTDHLHPNLKGITLMGTALIGMMESRGLVPAKSDRIYPVAEAVDLAQGWRLTRLDSTYTELRLAYLRGGWPFVPLGEPNESLQNYKPADFIDELAFRMFTDEINWENAHVRAAMWYKEKQDEINFINEMLALIEVMPFNQTPYKILIDGLINLQSYDQALVYLKKLHRQSPGAYSYKWQGILYLYRKQYQKAREYLLAAKGLDPLDAQLLYNLCGIYIHFREYEKALSTVTACLQLDPAFPGAQKTYDDLIKIIIAQK